MRAITIAVAILVLLLALTPVVFRNLEYDDFVISGMVTDEAGRSLEDVGVRVVAGRITKMGTSSENNGKFEKIDTTFRYEYNNYSNVSLWFFKEGYEEQRLQWSGGGTYSGVIVVMKRKATTTQSRL